METKCLCTLQVKITPKVGVNTELFGNVVHVHSLNNTFDEKFRNCYVTETTKITQTFAVAFCKHYSQYASDIVSTL